MSERFRVIVVGLLVALVVVGLRVDASFDRSREAGDESVAAPMVVAPRGDATTASWFCAGMTAAPDGAFDGTVLVANPTGKAVVARVNVVPVAGDVAPKAVTLDVGPNARGAVRLQDVLQSPYVAALVEVDSGDVIVEHSVTGALGDDLAPCSPRANEVWHFAGGSTVKDANLLLAVFNPFPDDAIVDMAFVTSEGRAVPSELQGVVIPGRGLVVRDVADFVRRREEVSTTVTARTGRVVVDKIQLVREPRPGLTLLVGTPTPAPAWDIAEGYITDGVGERIDVYNPNDREAAVEVGVSLDDGAVEPFQLTVPAQGRTSIDLGEDGRIPLGVGHALTVRAVDGRPIVVEHLIESHPPSARFGLAAQTGSTSRSSQWVAAAGGATESLDEGIVVHNPGATDVRFSVFALANGRRFPIEGLQDLEVKAGRRRGVRLGEHLRRPDLPVIVVATSPVVVQRSLFRVGAGGVSTTPLVPLLPVSPLP
ncbi:MAG TPA: DUF5719 family protein [Acidimicrobiales bacterium]|nr:DUF5719 family protein [Acidimicrobiales bacterium]